MGRHPRYGIGNVVNFNPDAFAGKDKDPEWNIIEDCCPHGLFKITDDEKIAWDKENCIGCLGCLGVMNPRGIFEPSQDLFDATDIAIADAALAVTKTVPKVGVH